MFQLLDRTPQLPPSGNEKPTGSPAGAALEFKDVSFAYPSRPTAWVLRNFSLEVCVVSVVDQGLWGRCTRAG